MTGAYPSVPSNPFLGIRSPRVRRIIFGLYVLVELVYLTWRVVFTIQGAPSIYAWILLSAELYAVLNAMWFYVLLGPKKQHSEPPISTKPRDVDVFIATYNEDVDLVRTTAIAARDIDYPHKTWILDDGRRPAMKAMAESIGVGYLTRPTNEHYKAGNLNNALAHTTGELVMVLDADHIPRRNFLTRVIGYFEDPEVSLVQTPQVYYNIASFQHRTSLMKGRLWHEGRIFQHRIMAGAERVGSAFFIGTGAVLRRSALEEIGGFATGSVTEDIFTSMRLHAKGYRSVFGDEPLGFMQAPQSPHAYGLQRLRWAQGGLQILRRENPLFKRGLSFVQRIAYLNALGHSLSCFPNLVFYLAPALYLLFLLNPINAAPNIVIPMLGAHLLVNTIVYKLLAAPDGRVMESSFFKFVNLPIYLRASVRLLFPKGLPFKVTPKGRQSDVPVSFWLPAIILILFHILAIAVGLRRVFGGEVGFWVTSISYFFSGSFVALGLFVLHRTFSVKPDDDIIYVLLSMDTLVRHSGAFDWQLARLQSLGPSMAEIECPGEVKVGDFLQLDLTATGMQRPISGRVTDADPTAIRNRSMVHLEWVDIEAHEQEVINRFLFNTALPTFLNGFVDAQSDGPPPDAIIVRREQAMAPLAAFTPGALPAVGKSRSRARSGTTISGSFYRIVAPMTPLTGYPVVTTADNSQPQSLKPLTWVNPKTPAPSHQTVSRPLDPIEQNLSHRPATIARLAIAPSSPSVMETSQLTANPQTLQKPTLEVRGMSPALRDLLLEYLERPDDQKRSRESVLEARGMSPAIRDLLLDYLAQSDGSTSPGKAPSEARGMSPAIRELLLDYLERKEINN